jgi:hypothetical protein
MDTRSRAQYHRRVVETTRRSFLDTMLFTSLAATAVTSERKR